MGFRQLEYQDRVLTILGTYLDFLREEKKKFDEAAKLVAEHPNAKLRPPNFAEEAWKRLKAAGKLPISRKNIPYSERKDGCEHPVPNAVLKVPTGGGKTFLAVSGISQIMGQYLSADTGFVLWIVPNEAIYRQTLKHFKDRQHPYRQTLDRAAAGRVKIMEKMSRLDARDVEGNLCVMLLMLQSANRETKESLKLFQDRGDVHGFSPPEGEEQAHREAEKRIPNLDTYSGGLFPRVKDSLGNALRIIRPVVVLDEGHKAISDLAFKTLYGFNPSFVLELTATPKDVKPRGGKNPRKERRANLLVEVTGRDLDREEMIKMPLTLNPCQGTDWRATLDVALTKLGELQIHARNFQSETNRYIRPILLVQVERTGKDQRESDLVHSEDVREWLLTKGLDEPEIAIKTSEQNDLSKPENRDLLSSTNRVRVIITKQALQEGWDCPFAYILCTLAASHNLSALTQLVGRILRQPGAMKTGNNVLDECYVITHHAKTAVVVEAIKAGLKSDGLGDLVVEIKHNENLSQVETGIQRIQRRSAFHSTEIYLPKVMVVEGNEMRELDYEMDVQSQINWEGFSPDCIADEIPRNAQPADGQLQRIYLADDDELIHSVGIALNSEELTLNPVYTVQRIIDLVPNPFIAREIVGGLLERLNHRGFDKDMMGKIAGLIADELHRRLEQERDRRAELLFKKFVADGHIQFRLRLDGRNWRMPRNIDSNLFWQHHQLMNKYGGPLERSLFTPQFESEFNQDERDVAVYLDGEEALTWWHRNVARSQYGIQGWKKGKVYPDFIFATRTKGSKWHIAAVETKGDHLGNDDTNYKRELLSFLTSNYAWETSVPAGELELVSEGGTTVHCELVLMSEWKTRLPKLLGNESTAH
ncbi:MAG: DEAD/DEAH box helicase family protein [Bacteroidetes bacterium]|nr:DEAD/DEAH box helicase family protein [Bacteroidota bacterium]